MKKACLYTRNDPALTANGIFTASELYGMKSDGYVFRLLKERLKLYGVEINTQDITRPSEALFTICLDVIPETVDERNFFLIVTEPPTYTPDAWKTENHKKFRKVFIHDYTYETEDPSTYRFVNYPIDFDDTPDLPIPTKEEFESRNFACLINGSITKPQRGGIFGSLLPERYRIIEWYSVQHPEKLHFYGRGIQRKMYAMSFRGLGLLKKVLPDFLLIALSRIVQRRIVKVYKGEIKPLEKIQQLSQYKFNFCLENTSFINGYITEKLFDCFYSKTIPIYCGAPNIKEVVPEGSYILYSNFSSQESLYDYLLGFSYADAAKMFRCQQEFLGSQQGAKLSSENYCNILLDELRKNNLLKDDTYL